MADWLGGGSMKPMTLGITGATGRLGGRIATRLATAGVEQRLLLLLGQRMDLSHRRSVGHGGGKCQRQRGHQGADKRRD